jgi:Pyruvate/2-oxoacid:ferredoxin oxidoreductase delta subunit
MASLPPADLRVVLYEGEGSSPLEPARRLATLTALLNAGYQVSRVVAGGQVTPADHGAMLVLGEFTDGAPALSADSPEASRMHIHDIAGAGADAIAGSVEAVRSGLGVEKPGAWTPWFPVIDYQRCTNCMQCLSFCLFDVYGVDGGGQLTVESASNCKTSCPACSRVCPEAAIMFPKFKQGPINGDQVREEDLNKQAMKVDISSLLGGDIYASLRGRQKAARERFSSERDESKALLERKRCLKKLQDSLDIPDEVLMTLPSAGDIEERAQRARDKHAKRMARSQTVRDQRPAPTEDDWGI